MSVHALFGLGCDIFYPSHPFPSSICPLIVCVGDAAKCVSHKFQSSHQSTQNTSMSLCVVTVPSLDPAPPHLTLSLPLPPLSLDPVPPHLTLCCPLSRPCPSPPHPVLPPLSRPCPSPLHPVLPPLSTLPLPPHLTLCCPLSRPCPSPPHPVLPPLSTLPLPTSPCAAPSLDPAPPPSPPPPHLTLCCPLSRPCPSPPHPVLPPLSTLPPPPPPPVLPPLQASTNTQVMAAALLECQQQGKMLVFTSLLRLERVSAQHADTSSQQTLLMCHSVLQCVQELTAPNHTPDHTPTHMLWQLKLAWSYTQLYHSHEYFRGDSPVLTQHYVAAVNGKVWKHLNQSNRLLQNMIKSYLLSSEGVRSRTSEELVLLVMALVWFDIPAAALVKLNSNCKYGLPQ